MKNAVSIFHGRVSHRKKIKNSVYIITMRRYRVLKSSYIRRRGPRNIEIAGVKGGNLCGAGIPKVGEEVIVFVCPNRNRSTWRRNRGRWWKKYWKINQYKAYSGLIKAPHGSQKYIEVRNLARRLKNVSWRTQCGKSE